MEQLNIEGKRSGEGFIAHKATLEVFPQLSIARQGRWIRSLIDIMIKNRLNYYFMIRQTDWFVDGE